MARRTILSLAAALVVAAAGGSRADDIALVLANSDYEARPDVSSQAANALADALEARGWQVITAPDASAERARAAAAQLRAAIEESPEPDRVLIALSGQYAHGARDGWFMARQRELPDLYGVGAVGLSLNALFETAALAPGHAVVLIGLPEDAGEAAGAGLFPGPGRLPAPQGVTVAEGTMQALGRWALGALTDPALSLSDALAAMPEGATWRGFSSRAVFFGESEAPSNAGEIAYWSAVQDIGTPEALEAYLGRYPNGIFAAEARAGLKGAAPEPAPPSPREVAKTTEDALGLRRSDRRKVQQDLKLLAYDPRGVDGIFGAGSRAAIAAWQKAQGYEDTGFLTGPQLAEMQRQAAVRQAEIDREARLEREARERADRAYWQSLTRSEADLEAYIGRYPNGIFAGEARARLKEFEEARAEEARQQMERDWSEARGEDSLRGYRRFLRAHPESRHEAEARARIAALRGDPAPEPAPPAPDPGLVAQERQVVPNGTAAALVEQILAAKGYAPGRVDGNFTEETRAAIRRFQQDQRLPVTGYVSQRTMVVLMLARKN